MAGFQTASVMVPDHPVLYGTTLAISLVGSVAALSSGAISVPVARAEYAHALGLAETVPAAVTSPPVMNAADTDFANERAVSNQADGPNIATPEGRFAIAAVRPENPAPIGLEAVPPIAAPRLAKADFAARPRLELKAAPLASSEAVNAELPGQPLEPLVTAPAGVDAASQPSQSFTGAFQAMPVPSLAVLPEQHDAASSAASSDAHISALITAPAVPGQGLTAQQEAALTPVSVAAPRKQSDFPATAPAMMQALVSAPETLAAPVQVAKLTATSGTLPAQTSLQQAKLKPVPAASTVRLISSPELRKFDLARIHTLPRTPATALAQPAANPAQAGKARIAGAKDKLVGDVVFHRVTVTVAGSPTKPLDVRIGADMKPSIRVGDLLGLVADRMDPASAARFASAASAEEYVSLAALRASGFNVSYNAASDSISIGAGE